MGEWDNPLMDPRLQKALDEIKDIGPGAGFNRPNGKQLKALRSCLKYTIAEWATTPRAERDPYLLLELWEANTAADGVYAKLARIRLDWLGYVVLAGACAGMFGCHYTPDDAREMEMQLSRVVNGMLAEKWKGYPSYRNGIPAE